MGWRSVPARARIDEVNDPEGASCTRCILTVLHHRPSPDLAAAVASQPILRATDAAEVPQGEFSPNDTVYLRGSGLEADTRYDVIVTRPDGSILNAVRERCLPDDDAAGTPVVDANGDPACWDSVPSDADGGLTYEYSATDLEGTYDATLYVSPWGGLDTGTPVITGLSFSVSSVAASEGPPAETSSTTTTEPPSAEPTGEDLAAIELAVTAETGVQYIVQFSQGAAANAKRSALAGASAAEVGTIDRLNMSVIKLPANAHAQKAAALAKNPNVLRVELDLTRSIAGAPNDTNYAQQWSLPQIDWDLAYGSITPSGSATIAVLDTGIDGIHPDLDGNLVAGTSILDGSNGLTDSNGHGTWLAGIAAAETGNSTGIAGVAYAGVNLMPVTVLAADGTGTDSDIIAGVLYAADNGADVILMGFSNPGYSQALQDAIDYAWNAGAVIVAATGNDGSSTATYPAGMAGVMGVSATTQTDTLASGSNYGDAVFLGAPGTVRSTPPPTGAATPM